MPDLAGVEPEDELALIAQREARENLHVAGHFVFEDRFASAHAKEIAVALPRSAPAAATRVI